MTKDKDVEPGSPHKGSISAKGSKGSYEAPIVLSFSEIQRGMGLCAAGTSDTSLCYDGGSNHDCYSGTSATDNCGVGTVGIAP